MEKRPLGHDSPLVSAVGVGAMSFGDFYGPTTEENSHSVLTAALDNGIDHIDVANVYGMGGCESAIGSFLAKQGAQKEGLFKIATKASITRHPETGARIFDNSKAHLTSELEGSLKRLGLDSVELFYVHRRDPEIPIEEVADTLAGLVRAGKIRRFGFSEISPASLRRARAVHPVAAVQSEYSLSVRGPELGLLQTTASLGTALVAFSPVGRGILTDRPHSAAEVAEIGFMKNNPRFMEPNHTANLKITDGFRALAKDMGTSTAALAIAWVLHRGKHVHAIPGTRSVAHFEELVAGGNLTLTEEDMARIDEVLPIGWAHGDRYSVAQWVGPERYC